MEKYLCKNLVGLVGQYVTFDSLVGLKNLGKYYMYKFLTVYAGHEAVQVRPERDSGRS